MNTVNNLESASAKSTRPAMRSRRARWPGPNACRIFATLLSLALWSAQVLAATGPASQSHRARVIFDTDIGNDVDDVLALSMLHALQTRGACDLLGVTITKPDELAGPFVDAIDTFYGRPGVPIGFTRAGLKNEPSKFLPLAEQKDQGKLRYPHHLKRSSDAPAATDLLRRI